MSDKPKKTDEYSNKNISVKNKAEKEKLADRHLFYLGGLLVEAMRNFHGDIMEHLTNAYEIVQRPTYLRVMELTDKFEQAAFLTIGE